jgi:hypothetical protein
MKIMKTKNLLHFVVLFVAAIALTFTSCKKDNLDQSKADPSSMEQLSADENNVENIMNDAESDVTSVMSNHGNNFKSTEWLPCNATVDSVAAVNDTIVIHITYNGLNCSGTRNRTGVIEIRKRVGTHWAQPGATVIYKYINFTVTRVSNNKSVTLNGSKTFVNVNGGHRWQVGTILTSYVERISGLMQASFDNGTSRSWNVARQVTYTGTPGQYTLTIDGFGSAGNYSSLVVWGINRQGEVFYSQIIQSIVCKQACQWDPCSGIKIHQIPADNKSATLTFGYDDNNQPITGDDCPTRYRVDWQRNNNSGTSYLPL